MFGGKFTGTNQKPNHPMVGAFKREPSNEKTEKVKGVKDYDEIRELVRENPRMVSGNSVGKKKGRK